jgi:hypothetical protein
MGFIYTKCYEIFKVGMTRMGEKKNTEFWWGNLFKKYN